MKKLLIIALLLLVLPACTKPLNQDFADKLCNDHRGVMATYPNFWPTTVICKDGVEFNVNYEYKVNNAERIK